MDLRSLEECHGDYHVPVGCVYERISAIRDEDERDLDLDMIHGKNKDMEAQWLASLYRFVPFHNEAYARIFAWMKENEMPIYFNCSAGKDRNGICGA